MADRNWPDVPLGDLFNVKHGFAFKSRYFDSEGGDYIVVTPGNFAEEGGFQAKSGKEKFYTAEPPAEYVLDRGDLLIVMTEKKEGLIGSAGFVPVSGRYLHNQRLGLVVDLDSNRLDRQFLFYLMNHNNTRQQLSSTASGTKVRHTSPTRIGQVRVRLPPLNTQRTVSFILSAYDDLIENNARRIEILEEMARAIYQEWFVDFQFPGHENVEVEETKDGRVPKGWEVSTLGATCRIVMGQSPKSEFYNDKGLGLPFHQGVTNFGFLFPTHKNFTTVTNRTAEEGDVLFSVRAPVGRINVANTRLVVGRGLSAIGAPEGAQAFTLYQLKQRFLEEDTIGGGTIFKAVTKSDVHGIPYLCPAGGVVEEFESHIGPMVQLLRNLDEQNRRLVETRDLLLPKLVSGEIDVSELDIDLGDAA